MNCIGLGCGGAAQSGQPFKPGRKITIQEKEETQDYDFLVVACDPQDDLNEKVMQKTATEKRVFSPAAMKSFTFQTTLMKFPKVEDDKDKDNNPIEVFNPVNLDKSKGLLHSYRSETRKEAYEQTAALSKRNPDPPRDIFQDKLSKVSYEYVTCYQLVDNENEGGMTEVQLWEILQEQA